MFVYKFVVFLVIVCALSGSTNADENCKDLPIGHPRACCSFTSKMRKELVECVAEKRKNNTCFVDCLIDAVDEAFTNNDIDRDALVSFSTNYLEGEDPSPLFAQTMERCIVRIKEQIQADTNLKEHKLRHNRSCHRSLLKLTNCLNHEVFLNCPVNMWKNNDQCEEWKIFSSKCPYEFREVYKPRRYNRRV